jgi:hypothetical protein
MSQTLSKTDQLPVVTITRHRRHATLRFDPFRFVFYFPESLWSDILKEIEAAGCRYLLGITTLFVLDVPLADAPELARSIAQTAAPYLRQSGLWLSEDGEPPPLVGYAARSFS